MQHREIGKTGIKASVVSVGAWALGGWMWGGSDPKDSIEAIHAALDNGVNLIDTAPIYGFGVSEELVGDAIKGKRSKIVLATKCGMVCGNGPGDFMFNSNAQGIDTNGHIPVRIYQGRNSVREEVEKSLKRLKTDYIDVLQTHWQDSTTPISETLEVLLKLKEEGKIRTIGACNANVNELSQYVEHGQLDVNQEKYSMLDRAIEKEQLSYCQEHDISVFAYSPLSNGLLTGKLGPEREFSAGDLRKDDPRFSTENREVVSSMLKEFSPIAENYNASIAQLVTAWTIAQPGVTHALCGMRNAEQAIENSQAGDISLRRTDVNQITSILEKYKTKLS